MEDEVLFVIPNEVRNLSEVEIQERFLGTQRASE
jgi:hypothetical protein